MPWSSAARRALLAGFLCALASACQTTGLGSGLVGDLGGFGRDVQVQAYGIRGTVLDVTGLLTAVQDERSHTIFTVVVPQAGPEGLQPGMTVEVSGVFSNGLIRARSVAVTGGRAWPQSTVPAEDGGRISHVLFLLQENHSFDNYFGTFPGADGFPPGVKVEGTAPFHLRSARTGNLAHGKATAEAALDEGNMDRFVSAEHSRDTMGYYDQSDIPNYRAYARYFTLADRFFSSFMGPSLPNHLFALAADAGKVSTNMMVPPAGGFAIPSLAERLESAGISWKVYDGGAVPGSFSGLNPLPGFSSLMKSAVLRSRVVPASELFRDLRNGSLPAAAWIFPDPEESEHPLTDIRVGMWYVTAVVNALMKSSAWHSTVLVVSWDEYGGFYDHVAPPRVDAKGYGPRVPALIISAYSRSGVVDHTLYDFTSVLRFMEKLFGVPPLSARDAQANDIGKSLDMSQPPLPPFFITAPYRE